MASAIDIAGAREAFKGDGRVQLCPFLSSDSAALLIDHIAARADWAWVFNARDRVYEIDTAARTALSAGQHAALTEGIARDARYGFQYSYEAIRVPDDDDDRAAIGSPLAAFARFLSSATVVDLVAQITDCHDIAFADAQATRFAAGHFLTAHDDAVAGKHRRLAYTVGLSPAWRTEWGGLLLFHDAKGNIDRGLTPRANTLSLFAVPQAHSVSIVAPSADGARLSVTGWMRARP